MKIINPYTEILTPLDGQAILQHIELCGGSAISLRTKSPTPAPPSLWRASSSVAMRPSWSTLTSRSSLCVIGVCPMKSSGTAGLLLPGEHPADCNYSKDVFGSEITVIRPSFLTEGTRAGSIGKWLAGWLKVIF